MLKKFFLFIGIFFILTCNLWSQDYIEKILIQGNQRVELETINRSEERRVGKECER